MPWTEADVAKHNAEAAKSSRRRSKWVSIANDALRRCQDEGGKDCEGTAIRIANSKV